MTPRSKTNPIHTIISNNFLIPRNKHSQSDGLQGNVTVSCRGLEGIVDRELQMPSSSDWKSLSTAPPQTVSGGPWTLQHLKRSAAALKSAVTSDRRAQAGEPAGFTQHDTDPVDTFAESAVPVKRQARSRAVLVRLLSQASIYQLTGTLHWVCEKKRSTECNLIEHFWHLYETWTGREENFSFEITLALACQRRTRKIKGLTHTAMCAVRLKKMKKIIMLKTAEVCISPKETAEEALEHEGLTGGWCIKKKKKKQERRQIEVLPPAVCCCKSKGSSDASSVFGAVLKIIHGPRWRGNNRDTRYSPLFFKNKLLSFLFIYEVIDFDDIWDDGNRKAHRRSLAESHLQRFKWIFPWWIGRLSSPGFSG